MKKWRRLRRIAGTGAFFALLFLAVALTSHLLERKESSVKYGAFLKNPSQYDVLFLGNSHAVNAAYPMELWRDYGITSYNLSGYGDTVPVSYWVLMNALDQGARPSVVVVDVDDIGRRNKTSESSGDVHTALDWLPLTLTKARAIEDLMSDPNAEANDGEVRRYVDIKWEYYFTLGAYHERWQHLTQADFSREADLNMGADMSVEVAAPRDYDVVDVQGWEDNHLPGFVYLRRIVEECQARGIDVLLTFMPFPVTLDAQDPIAGVQYIEQDYGLHFIDFVSMDSVVDYGTDCYDSYSHLNPSGARKVTDYLGQVLRERYGVADHRGDEAYGAWDAQYDAYTDYKLDLVRNENGLAKALMLLHDGEFSVMINVREGSAVYQDGVLLSLMQNIAREHLYEENALDLWSDSLTPLAQLSRAAAYGVPYFAVIDRADGRWNAQVQERPGVGKDVLVTSFGEVEYRSDESGAEANVNGRRVFEAQTDAPDVRIAVIDRRTNEVAAVLEYDVQ